MGRDKDNYKDIICEILNISERSYFRYAKEKRIIIKLLKSFSPFALESFVNNEEINRKFFEIELGYVRLRSFVNELNNRDLLVFSSSLEKSKNFEEFLSSVKNSSPSLYVDIIELSAIVEDFQKKLIMNKKDLLKYIKETFWSDVYKKETINFNLKNFIFNAITKLDLDKFSSKRDMVMFVYDMIIFSANYAKSSESEKYEAMYLFKKDRLIKEIEAMAERMNI